jgi:hypothetical protein
LPQARRAGGEDVDDLIQVPVGGGLRQPEAGTQPRDVALVAKPRQPEQRLPVTAQLAGSLPGTDLAAAGGQQPGDEQDQLLAAMLSAHRSAAFGVYVLAALGGDDAAGGRSSGCAVAGMVAVEEAGKHVDEFEQQRVDLGLLVSGVLGAVAGDEPVPSGGCLLFVLGGVVPGLVAGLPPAQGFGPVHGAGRCW